VKKISSKFVKNFWSYPTNRQNKQRQKHNRLGGGNRCYADQATFVFIICTCYWLLFATGQMFHVGNCCIGGHGLQTTVDFANDE